DDSDSSGRLYVFLAEPPEQPAANKPTPQIQPVASIPKLTAPVPIIDKDKLMWSGRTACPEMVDWNNDGKRDLLVGMFSKGQIMLFTNTGTDTAPEFETGELLTAGGEEIHVGFG
ncbi:MAG: hypothetical protein GY869_24840, partial [Planctomycetes bacterium]|nr:hypothetical protein [Planctomycetota bacterium]